MKRRPGELRARTRIVTAGAVAVLIGVSARAAPETAELPNVPSSTTFAVPAVSPAVQVSAAAVRIDLAAQPAARALIALSRQTGIEVLFLYDELKDVPAAELHCTIEPAEALRRLLAASRHRALADGPGRFIVVAEHKTDGWHTASVAGSDTGAAGALPPRASAASSQAGASDVVTLDRFVVEPGRFGMVDALSARSATFSHDEIDRMPHLGEDVYRAVARVPGLAASDFSAQFWVRGASHDRVLTRLDGGTMLEPFHVKGLGGALSVIDLETVSSVDLQAGGFSADYGDRLGGVLEIATVRSTEPRPRSTLGVSLMGLRATNRGTFADGRGAWLASGRSGYPDITLSLATDEDLRPRYHDLFAKVEYDLTPAHTLALHCLSARDRLRYTDREDGETLVGRYRDDTLWLRWRGDLGAGVSVETVAGAAWLGWNRDGASEATAFLRETRFALADHRDLERLSLRQAWSLALGPDTLVRLGGEVARAEAGYRYESMHGTLAALAPQPRYEDATRSVVRDVAGRDTGAFASWRQRLGSVWIAEAGLRLDRHGHSAGDGTSPRVSVARAWGRTTWRASWGVYRQAQGLHELAVGDGQSAFARAEVGRQSVLGAEHRLAPGWVGRAEVFVRTVENPRPHWENVVSPVRLLGELEFDRFGLKPERGRSRGVELTLRRVARTVRWSAGYALSRAEESVDGRWLPLVRDQRHAFLFDCTYSPDPRWDFSVAWQFRTGWPTTDYRYVPFQPPGGGTLFRAEFGPLYAARLPAYHRLDVRVTRTWHYPRWTLRGFVDVFNLYGAANPFAASVRVEMSGGVYRQSRRLERSLPLLPSAGLQWDF